MEGDFHSTNSEQLAGQLEENKFGFPSKFSLEGSNILLKK